MSRPQITKKKGSRNDPPEDCSLNPMKRPHPNAANHPTVPLLLLADSRVYTQDTTLPSKPGQVGLQHPILGTFAVFCSQPQDSDATNEIDNVVRAEPDVFQAQELPSGHRTKRNQQLLQWRNTAIPQLIQLYMELLRTTENLYHDPSAVDRQCVCGRKGEPPNHRAWCNTVTELLGAQGYKMRGQDPLQRHFSNALQWFGSLKHATKGLANQILNECREIKRITEDHHPLPPDSSPPSSRPTLPFRSSSPDISVPEDAPEDDNPWAGKCPLCFGGAEFELNLDAIVCIDSCFMQKHNRGVGKDLLKTHPDSVSMAEEEANAMEETVESIRPCKPTAKRAGVEVEDMAEDNENDRYEGSMEVPRSALDGCKASFTAADEQRGG
ncbi:hypothetical protein V5O48_014090 [Marasmius crinis-equi]|uniref:Uncharacterized protein n=1 Tax=Marasmius crinis-equi TaxID=585013 RepID=A0ABR3EYA5_9AGAR